MSDEVEEIQKRYARREEQKSHNAWSPLLPYNLFIWQERERALASLLRGHLAGRDIETLSCMEVGCGTGGNLLQLIKLGFLPEKLTGNELLEDRVNDCIHRLPERVKILAGDALQLDVVPESLDIVYQSTVFSSILDDDFQAKLADKMWSWVKPGGGILWYDFIYNNPNNRDVRGIPVKRMRALFPDGKHDIRKITLAPPIGRRLGRTLPFLLPFAGSLSPLRSHILCWIEKPLS